MDRQRIQKSYFHSHFMHWNGVYLTLPENDLKCAYELPPKPSQLT